MDSASTPWSPHPASGQAEAVTAAPTIFPRVGYSILSFLMFINTVLSIFNNGLAITVMLKNPALLQPINIFILSLAVSDLMIGLCGSLVVTITNYQGSFFIGHTACVFQGFAVNYFGLVSLCTLTLLAYERYNVVCKPRAGLKLNMRRSLERSWNNYSYLILYTLLCFILPVGVIIYCYTKVLTSMNKLNKSVELQGGRSCQKENDHAISMVLAMIIAFFVCWLPYTALSVVVVVDPELRIPPLVATMPMYFAKTSPVYNPIIYFLSNKQVSSSAAIPMNEWRQNRSCCIQLLTLACISAERYQAIAQPFKTTQRRRRIMVLIPVTWILAIVVAGFCLMFVKDSPVYMRCKGLQGQSFYDTFGLYILFPLWAVCFAVIIGFYARIFLLVRSHNRKIFDKGIHPSKTEKADTKQENGGAAEEYYNPEQKQTLSKGIEQVGPETLSKTNSCVKDTPAVPVTSAEAPQCVPDGSEHKNDLSKSIEILDLEGKHPPLTYLSVQSEEKTIKTEKLVSPAKKVEAKASKGDTFSGDTSSRTKPQKVSSISDTEKPSKEGVQTHQTRSEMEERSPHGPSSALSANPESTLLMQLEGTQKQGSEEPSPAAPAEPPLPTVPANVPEINPPRQDTDVEGPVCMMPSKERRERASKNKESKMAKRAGYIIITFLLFWLPLIASILGNFITLERERSQVMQ
ncbi:unnamed protein product [Tetraodon nigroviridis]|uniref:(spotted green pufferfish) hypothetical protein n=1 Tax=Tetraodon nigroviridis TaxID=99883 RepID=Q4RSC6_TETNG|nr:unnamed protein product [Tetraodon nigroviridis]